jgi:hypothetical protein
VAEAVVLGYCCGFLVKEGFAWVGGIAAVGRERVKIGDKGPLDWIRLDWRDRREYHTLGETARRPNEIGPRPPHANVCPGAERIGTRRNVVESRESRVLAFGSLSSAWTAD